MLNKLPEPSTNAAKFVFPNGAVVPSPAHPSQTTDGCMHAMHDDSANGVYDCWLAKLQGMQQKYVASNRNKKPHRLRNWTSFHSNTPSNIESATPPNGAEASTSAPRKHALQDVPDVKKSSERYAMLCAAVMRDGHADACKVLPSEAAMAGALRRAARKYSVQLSMNVLEASGLWPLDFLHEVRSFMHGRTSSDLHGPTPPRERRDDVVGGGSHIVPFSVSICNGRNNIFPANQRN